MFSNFVLNSCIQFCQNVFLPNYNNRTFSSITDYVPNELQEKIFQDIKKKNLSQSFILQYTLDDFKKYVTKQNFQYYDQFMSKFKGKDNNTFTILILNWSVFNDQKLKADLEVYKKQCIEKINQIFGNQQYISIYTAMGDLIKFKQFSNDELNKIYKNNANQIEINKLFTQLNTQLSKTVFNQIMGMFYSNQIPNINLPIDINKDCKINKTEMMNFVKILNDYKFQQSKNIDKNVFGFCFNLKQNFKTIDGFVYFINKDLTNLSKEPLKDLYDLINHQIDHYFQTSLFSDINTYCGKSQADLIDPKDKQVIDSISSNIYTDKKFLYYLFQRSEFNSRCTDVCNFLLTSICPVQGDNALRDFLNAIQNIVKFDNLNVLLTHDYKWFQQTPKIMAIVAFSAMTLKLFPQTKWETLNKRLNKDFKQYLNLTDQQKQLYTQEIKKKFS